MQHEMLSKEKTRTTAVCRLFESYQQPVCDICEAERSSVIEQFGTESSRIRNQLVFLFQHVLVVSAPVMHQLATKHRKIREWGRDNRYREDSGKHDPMA